MPASKACFCFTSLGQRFVLAFFLVALFPSFYASNSHAHEPQPDLAWVDLGKQLDYTAQRDPVSETVVHVTGYTYVNDRERLLDDLLDTREAAARLETNVRQLNYRFGDEAELISLLKQMDGHATTAQAGIGLVLAAPFVDNRYSLSALATTRFAGTFHYSPGDEAKLRLAPIIAFIELAELESRVMVSGVGKGELALHRLIEFESIPSTRFAVSLKHQEIWLYERSVQIQRYRESDLFKLSDFTRKFSRPNADLSAVSEWGDWTVSLNLRDLFESTYRGPRNSRFHLRTRAELGVQYQLPWARLSLERDLSPQPAFGEMLGRRETKLAINLPLSERFEIGASYLHVERDRDEDVYSASLAYHLLDSFHLGVTGSIANGRELGGAFSIQLPLF